MKKRLIIILAIFLLPTVPAAIQQVKGDCIYMGSVAYCASGATPTQWNNWCPAGITSSVTGWYSYSCGSGGGTAKAR